MFPFLFTLVLYFASHSVLAAESVKKWTRHHTGWSPMAYRRFYNLIALVGLGIVLWLYFRLAEWSLWAPAAWVAVLGWGLVLAGLVTMYLAMRPYDTAEFLGLRAPEHAAGLGELSTGGLNAYVRHPLYAGILLFFWGNVLRTASGNALVLALIGTVYIYVGARLEERKLVQAFGEVYAAYCRRTPMLWPRWPATRAKQSGG